MIRCWWWALVRTNCAKCCSRMQSAAAQEKVLRVNQLDAGELDGALSDVLQHQFLGIFKTLPSSRMLRFKPELKALVRALVWKYSIHASGRTFGQEMLGLNYSLKERHALPLASQHKYFLFVLIVLAEWLQDRLDLLTQWMLPIAIRPSNLQKILNWIFTITNTLSLLNFIVFLIGGRFPFLKERILSLWMVPERPQTLRGMSYEYMNREILWHGFSEFIFFVLPQFNVFALRNWFRRMLHSWKRKQPDHEAITLALKPADFVSCAFCEQPLTMPHVTNCGHVYCYYCLIANCLADSSFPCSVCHTPVNESWSAALWIEQSEM